MTYTDAVSYLYSLQKHGIKLGLDTMTALVGRLGMPQARYRTLHIAGTNGKGSTAAMTAAIAWGCTPPLISSNSVNASA